MHSELLPGYPTVDGTWLADEVREHEIRSIERIEAIAFTKAPRLPDFAIFLKQHGAREQQGPPVIVSGAYLYLICNAWLGPMFEMTLPVSAYWQFKRPVFTGDPLLARCTLKEPRLVTSVVKKIVTAELRLEVFTDNREDSYAIADVPIQMRI